jgi:hypothetical protein
MDTFVVRLRSPAEAGAEAGTPAATTGDVELHGTARHVASGRAAAFRSGSQLLGVIAELRDARPGARLTSEAPDRPGASVL